MTGALVIFVAMVIIGILLYVTDVTYFRHHHSSKNDTSLGDKTEEGREEKPVPSGLPDEICCGTHLVCEKTSLTVVSDEVIYYDDEELDRFKGRDPESYSSAETEEFRDVLMTLLPEDVAGWARSITLRKIELPYEVKDELLMLVSELRNS